MGWLKEVASKLFKKVWGLLTSNRFKSFYWRTVMMNVAMFAQLMLDNLDKLELSNMATIILGLILGEVSKQLNGMYQAKYK